MAGGALVLIDAKIPSSDRSLRALISCLYCDDFRAVLAEDDPVWRDCEVRTKVLLRLPNLRRSKIISFGDVELVG